MYIFLKNNLELLKSLAGMIRPVAIPNSTALKDFLT